MSLALLAVLGGLLVGRLGGGSLHALAGLTLRRPWLVLAAAVCQVAGALVPTVYGAGLALSALSAGAFLLLNRRLNGLPLVALGIALNAIVVLANGVMPVSEWAAERAGVSLPVPDNPHYAVGSNATVLRPLSDVIPVPLPAWPTVVSVGDILITAGGGLLVTSGMWGPVLARRPDEAADPGRTVSAEPPP